MKDDNKIETEDNLLNPADAEEKNPTKVDVLEELPPEIREVVQMGMSMQSFSGRLPNPIASKITEKHIDTILKITGEDRNRDFAELKSKRIAGLIIFTITIGVFIFLVVFIANSNYDLFIEILKLFVTFAGGIGAGYGLKSIRDNANQ